VPEYNFAKLPTVTSRYPLWDVKAPQLTTDVPHSESGDKGLEIDAGGTKVGDAEINPIDRTRMPEESAMHVETRHATAKELGIPMPSPTAKPLVTAFGMVVMISGMLFKHLDNQTPFYTLVLGGAVIMVVSLYAWLTTPLEEEH